ncbi:hypothetical protein BGW80DRAFT_1482366, partial [Lactifluus volemus]
MAEEIDKDIVETYQKHAEGTLIFSGLFSAAVAALVAVTVTDLKQDPQDKSAFYLGNIYQILACNSNESHPSIPATLPTFSPPSFTVWVNSLWILSLVISLTCAILAILLQQWSYRYVNVTQYPRLDIHHQARIHAILSRGIKKSSLMFIAETLPTLIHLSLFLFFSGLLIYLF